jgi:hypothetical protein
MASEHAKRTFDPASIRRRAKALFEHYFSGGDRETWLIPDDDDPSERAGLEELARHRLVTKRNGGFRLASRGVAVLMGELELDVALGLGASSQARPLEASAGTHVSVTYVNHGQVGAMGPQALAAANTFEQRSTPPEHEAEKASAARIRHERDVAAMRRAMSAIHLPSLDNHINRLPAYLTASGMWYFEQFEAVVGDGMFHLYDEDLKREVERLWRAWDAAMSEDQHYHSTLSGHQYVFRIPGDMPLTGEPKRAWARIDGARREMADARNAILGRLRSDYLEIDVTQTSERAFADYCAMDAEIDAEITDLKRGR